jgi:hypothetical protein
MDYFKKIIFPILLVGIWINVSETVRWIFLIKSYWIEHYKNMNLVFPNEPVNAIIWMIWGFIFAVIIYILSKKFSLLQTTFISWLVMFIMLWIVLWNINILPLNILWYVVPLSFIETIIAVLICKKLS